MSKRMAPEFFQQDVLEVAPLLLGNFLVRKFPDGNTLRYLITEVEAYRGEEDLACHASKGRTDRTEVMYHPGGKLYVYLIYGMYWMLNIVTGDKNNPQAVLIRGMEGFSGPGKITKHLQIDKDFYGEDLSASSRIWIEDNKNNFRVKTAPRIGVDYAGEFWSRQPWRFILVSR